MILVMRDIAKKPVTPKVYPRKLSVTSCLSLIKGGCCYCSCSVAKSCLTLCDPVDWSTPGSSVLHYLLEFAQIHVHGVGEVSNHLILCFHLLLLPLIFPSIKVFSNELAVRIRWPKYWSSRFRDNFSNEYSGLISFRID